MERLIMDEPELLILNRILKEKRIPDEEWKKISPCMFLLKLNKGEFLEQAGDIPDKIAFIIFGICRYFCFNETGNEKTTVFRQAGGFISGYTSHLQGVCSKLSIQAMVETRLLCMSIEDYEEILRKSDFWQMYAFKQGMKVIIEKEQREMEILNASAETRYMKFRETFPGLENQVAHYHIASYLGMSNVTLSRIRKNLKGSTF